MDIQSRKIEFVKEFLKLQNEELLTSLENLLRSKSSKKNEIKPLTVSELNKRIDKSIQDSENDRVTLSDDLMIEVGKWV